MKKYFLSLIAGLVIEVVSAQSPTDQELLYQKKINTYNRMQTAGWTMTGVGAGLSMTGSILLATLDDNVWADQTYESESGDVDDVIQAFGGMICLAVGVGLVAGGVTLGCIGSHKARTYRNKLDHISVGMLLTPQRQGFTLTYRF